MLLPNNIRTAVRNRQFRQLAHLDFVPKQNSPDPWMNNGRFGVVFKMRDPHTGKTYALKVIKEATAEKRDRLAAIAEAIKNYPSPYWVQYAYYPQELTVAAAFGTAEPADVLLMEWVEGDTLGRHFAQRCAATDRTALARLAYAFDMLALWLLHNPFAHGDLKQDNILVRPDGSLLLVDYDGVYLPAFAGQPAHELGTQDYQHPQRTERHFNADIDDFSIIAISLALYAAAENPDRHATYNEGDNLLLCANDYDTLTESPLLTDLKRSALPAIQQRVALLDYALALPPQGLIGLPHCITNVENYTQILAKTIADKQAQDWYDALPENLRDAVQINLQLQAAGITVEEIDKKRREREFPERASIYDIKNKLLPRNTNEIKITAKCLNEMRYFYNRWDKNLSDISSLRGLKNLQTLDLNCSDNLSDISLSDLPNLQTLNLSGSDNLSDISLSDLPNLQTLNLEDCNNLRGISLSDLPNLQILNLGRCENLWDISLSDLPNLQELNLRLCEALSDISLSDLPNLLELSLSNCENLSDISLSGLPNLLELSLSNCENLSDISPLSGLTNLQTLNLNGCKNLSDISTLRGLTNLQTLNLKDCENITQVQKDSLMQAFPNLKIDNEKSLNQLMENMKLYGFLTYKQAQNWSQPSGLRDAVQVNLQLQAAGKTVEEIEKQKEYDDTIYKIKDKLLPENTNEITITAKLLNEMPYFYNPNDEDLSDISLLSDLTNLQTLGLSHCSVSDISPLRGLTNLQTLDLSGRYDSRSNLTDISPLSGLTNLQTLNLNHCENLSDISPLSGLTSLQTLDLSQCHNLSDISPLSGLTNLKELYLSRTNLKEWYLTRGENTNLSDISPLSGLPSLQTLDLRGCDNLSDISLSNLPNLQTLDLSYCKNLRDISLSTLPNLQKLELSSCENLGGISLSGLTSLQTLNLSCCENLRDISPLSGLTNLQTLGLSYSKNLSDISPLSGLTNLQTLYLKNTNVSNISPLRGLMSLLGLSLSRKKLSDISPLRRLPNLQRLYLNECENLSDIISALSGLTNLQVLGLTECKNLSDISPLRDLRNLQELNLWHCSSLSDISPLRGLTNLQTLHLWHCSSLSDISPLRGLTNLQTLHLSNGTKISQAQKDSLQQALPNLEIKEPEIWD